MRLVCPECKNEIDLNPYPNLAAGAIAECNHCGISLMVSEIQNGEVKAVIVDEGK